MRNEVSKHIKSLIRVRIKQRRMDDKQPQQDFSFITKGSAEMFEWDDANLKNEDRVGRFVTLKEDKIEYPSRAYSNVLGITSVTPSGYGSKFDERWINVTMSGKAVVYHDGTLTPGCYVREGSNGIATISKKQSYCKLLRIIDSSRALVLLKPVYQSEPSSNTNSVLPGYYVQSDGGGYIHSDGGGYPVRLSDLHIGTFPSKYL